MNINIKNYSVAETETLTDCVGASWKMLKVASVVRDYGQRLRK